MTFKEFYKALLIAQVYMVEGWSFVYSLKKAGICSGTWYYKTFKNSTEFKTLHHWYFQGRKCSPPLKKKSIIASISTLPTSGITKVISDSI